MTILKTNRLLFRTWSISDLDLASRLWGDNDVMKWLDVRGGLPTDVVKKKLEMELETQERFQLQYWALFDSGSGDFVGCCGLRPWLHSPRPGTELGFHLVKEKWGQGYAREAATAVVDYAREKLPGETLRAGHHPENLGSKKILLGLGFSFVEHLLFKPTGLLHPSYELTPDVRSQ